MKKLSRTRGIVVSLAGAALITLFMVRGILAVGGPRVSMVMVTGMVKAGRPITESVLRTEKMPAKFAVDAVTDEHEAVGKLAAAELTSGHPLLKTDISNKPMQNGLYVGEYGVRISADLVSSGGAMPGDYVDVLVSAGKAASGQAASLSTLLHHKRVVAVFNSGGQTIETPSKANAASGLSVTPSGVYAPASVELAVNSSQERDQVLSAGKVVLSPAPWDGETVPAVAAASAASSAPAETSISGSAPSIEGAKTTNPEEAQNQ